MAAWIFAIGTAAAVALILLLLATLVRPALRIWPTPGMGSWQGYVFWPLFRGLNLLCFASAVTDRPGGYLALPHWLRSTAFLVLAAAVAIFVYAFRVLGRDNSYGAREGLVTEGIYKWSRNPQNAMLIAVYGCLALSADSGATYLLCAAMVTVYALMVLLEEPWLELGYGETYRNYCRAVPRFFNWKRAWGAVLRRNA